MTKRSVDERRSFPRHKPIGLLDLLVAEAPGGAVVRARLLDVSVGGAALLTEDPLPKLDSVWVRLADDDDAEWTLATVVHISGEQECSVRLRFAVECPFDLFREAVCGTPATKQAVARV